MSPTSCTPSAMGGRPRLPAPPGTLRRRPATGLVLLDLNLPRLDGQGRPGPGQGRPPPALHPDHRVQHVRGQRGCQHQLRAARQRLRVQTCRLRRLRASVRQIDDFYLYVARMPRPRDDGPGDDGGGAAGAERRPHRRGRPRRCAVAAVGPVPVGAGLGHGPGGLLRRRRRLVVLPLRARRLRGLPLERGRAGGHLRRRADRLPGPRPSGTATTPSSRSGLTA